MKEYQFEIKFDNENGGTSFEYFSCKAKTEKEARSELEKYLIYADKLGSEITLEK